VEFKEAHTRRLAELVAEEKKCEREYEAMEFTTKLSTFLSHPNLQFKYHNAPIKIKTLPKLRHFAGERINGALAGISSECAVWVHIASTDYGNTLEDPHSLHFKHIVDIELVDESAVYGEHSDEDGDGRVSIKAELFEIARFKAAEHLLSVILRSAPSSPLCALSAKNRKEFLNERTTDARRSEIADDILKMEFSGENFSQTLAFSTSEAINLLKAYCTLWKEHIRAEDTKRTDDGDGDAKVDVKETDSWSTFAEWDDRDARSAQSNSEESVGDVYVPSLWPHCFSGPYSKGDRAWKCQRCNKARGDSDGRVKYFKTKRTVLSFEVCALCVEAAKTALAQSEKQKTETRRAKRKEIRRRSRRAS